jgi:Domain of unknown function (DUF222)
MNENILLSVVDGPADLGSQDADALVPLERLEERICELAAHLAAGTCRFLQLVAEFDARGGWASWDLPSCSAWLAWKCQVAPGTAREQVRVARALGSLPHITAEFAAGRMSYAKVRALTRIATTATEAELAQVAGPMTAAQCERFAAAHRKASDSEELDSWAARRVRVHVGEDGLVTISAKLPAADGAVAKGGKTRLRDLVLLCEAHHVIVHALGYLITAEHGGFAFTRPDGQPVPHCPALPGSDGDLARCHDADITTDTIVPTGLADKLDLDLAIWACFANARIDAERASEQHYQELAA